MFQTRIKNPEAFTKIVTGFQRLTIFAKRSTKGSEPSKSQPSLWWNSILVDIFAKTYSTIGGGAFCENS